MTDFRVSATRRKTIKFRVTATRPDANGVQQPIDLTLANTKLVVTGRLATDAAPIFTKDYYQAGSAPSGGITAPAPGAATNVAEVTIPADEPGIVALTKTSYVMVDVELTETSGQVSKLAGGVIKVRYLGTAAAAQVVVSSVLPQIPVISRGQPFVASSAGAFGGGNAEANAIDGDYSTFWNSVTSPNGGTPQWFAIDLSLVAAINRKTIWIVLKNLSRPTYQPAPAPLGTDPASPFANLARNYRLQGHAAAGGGAPPAVGDAGWTDLVTAIVDNRWSERIHTGPNGAGLDLSGYNWFRVYVTAANGVAGNDAVVMQIDLRNIAAGIADSFLSYGDSISQEAFRGRRPDNVAWDSGPIENLIQIATGRVAPIWTDASTIGWHATEGDTNKVTYIGQSPSKYVLVNFGSNDANAANIDLATLGGVNSAYAQAYKQHLQNIINYCAGLGKVCIFPHIPWGDTSAWSTSNITILNAIIDQLVAANPGTALAGADLYTLFSAHPVLLRDHLHPTYDPATGSYQGVSGYGNLLQSWRDRLVAAFYT